MLLTNISEEKINSWFYFIENKEKLPYSLYCFPHAGGNAEDYLSWQPSLPNVLQKAVLFPGKGRRYQETYIDNFELLIESITLEINSDCPENYYLFGHSMGGIIAFEVARRVKIPAKGLIISACSSPNYIPSERVMRMSKLNISDFADEISFFNGISNELLFNSEMKEIIALNLKKDFDLISGYICEERSVIETPIISILGTRDPHVSVDKILDWHSFTKKYMGNFSIQGDHFYFNNNKEPIINIINYMINFNNIEVTENCNREYLII